MLKPNFYWNTRTGQLRLYGSFQRGDPASLNTNRQPFTLTSTFANFFPNSERKHNQNILQSMQRFQFSRKCFLFCMKFREKFKSCSAQTRTGIGLLGKPPTVKQFPLSKANRRTPLLRDLRANAGMKRTSVVEHNLYFAGLAIVG